MTLVVKKYNVGCGDESIIGDCGEGTLGPNFGGCTPIPSSTPNSTPPATPIPSSTPSPSSIPPTPSPLTPTPVLDCSTISVSVTDYYLSASANSETAHGFVSTGATCAWICEKISATYDSDGKSTDDPNNGHSWNNSQEFAHSFSNGIWLNNKGTGPGFVAFKASNFNYTGNDAFTITLKLRLVNNPAVNTIVRLHVAAANTQMVTITYQTNCPYNGSNSHGELSAYSQQVPVGGYAEVTATGSSGWGASRVEVSRIYKVDILQNPNVFIDPAFDCACNTTTNGIIGSVNTLTPAVIRTGPLTKSCMISVNVFVNNDGHPTN